MNIERAITAFERGTITLSEALREIIGQFAESSEPRNLLDSVPVDWQRRIWDEVESAPTDNTTRQNKRLFTIGAWTGKEAVDEFERRNREALQAYRRGVEQLRQLRQE